MNSASTGPTARTDAGYGPPSNNGSSATLPGAVSSASIISRPAAEVLKILTLPWVAGKYPRTARLPKTAFPPRRTGVPPSAAPRPESRFHSSPQTARSLRAIGVLAAYLLVCPSARGLMFVRMRMLVLVSHRNRAAVFRNPAAHVFELHGGVRHGLPE